MPSWFIIVIIGHLLTAVSFVLSKFLLHKSFSNPFVFTFYIGVLSLMVIMMAPWGFYVPSAYELGYNLLAGVVMAGAMLMLLIALSSSETSRVIPFVGAGVPVFTLLLELALGRHSSSVSELLAFSVLVVGSVVITYDPNAHATKKKVSTVGTGSRARIWIIAGVSALLFAIKFVMSDIAFAEQPFVNAFIWMSLGTTLAVLPLLFTSLRTPITQAAKEFTKLAGWLYIGAQSFGALGFLLINYSLTLASASIVNAMQGVQYVGLFVLAAIASKKYPQAFKESVTGWSLVTKIVGVVIISIGLALIV